MASEETGTGGDKAKRSSGKAKPDAKSSVPEFEQGEQVEHPLWGIGTIIYKQGNGDKQKLLVSFPGEPPKKLMVLHAKLKKVV
ncbi:MAG: hypothetical protein NTX50_32140 [Candidatus Sumerlaeota bacterium]|nr:hypothetical protein [Candidatus Sumerlaeota bacterium]